MKKNFLLKFLAFISILFFTNTVRAKYFLVIGTYRQGPGGRPEVSGITSPSLHAIPMKDIETCKNAGAKISEKIYKPVWQFDNKWTCIYSGISK